jgi:predicted glycoside hydrolase/deacetylase ChbG (UPF0249 family)
VPQSTTFDEMLADVDRVLKATGAVKIGQEVALTCGYPVATISPTNLVLLHRISG